MTDSPLTTVKDELLEECHDCLCRLLGIAEEIAIEIDLAAILPAVEAEIQRRAQRHIL